MGKAPAFQFYPGDWFREPGLKRVDLTIRGAWAELLMIMWDENPQGHIETHIKGYAQTWRIDIPQACFIIQELEINNIANVEYCDPEVQNSVHEAANYFQGLSPKCPDLSLFCTAYVSITNRRMNNDWKRKEYERLKKAGQRAKKESPSSVPKKSLPPSSSSSSSSKKRNSTKKINSPDEDFVSDLKKLPVYDGIDIDRELKKMDAWLLTPKGKGRRKTKRFIVNWLNRIDTEVKTKNQDWR